MSPQWDLKPVRQTPGKEMEKNSGYYLQTYF